MDCSNVVCKTLRAFVCRLPDRFRLNRESMWSPISIKFLVKKSGKIHHWHMYAILYFSAFVACFHVFVSLAYQFEGCRCASYTPRLEDSMIGDLLIEHFISWNTCTGRQPLQMFLGKVFVDVVIFFQPCLVFWNWGILMDIAGQSFSRMFMWFFALSVFASTQVNHSSSQKFRIRILWAHASAFSA